MVYTDGGVFSWPSSQASGGANENVNVHDGAGNAIGSTGGALNVSGSFATAVNTNGSFAAITSLTTVQSFTVPTNAVGFVLEALSTNPGNVRWCAGATATTTNGMRLEPGRDSGYIPMAKIISVCSESGTNEVDIQWVLSS